MRCTDVIKGRPQVICLIGLYVDLVSDELFEVSSVSISVELSYHRTQELKVSNLLLMISVKCMRHHQHKTHSYSDPSLHKTTSLMKMDTGHQESMENTLEFQSMDMEEGRSQWWKGEDEGL